MSSRAEQVDEKRPSHFAQQFLHGHILGQTRQQHSQPVTAIGAAHYGADFFQGLDYAVAGRLGQIGAPAQFMTGQNLIRMPERAQDREAFPDQIVFLAVRCHGSRCRRRARNAHVFTVPKHGLPFPRTG